MRLRASHVLMGACAFALGVPAVAQTKPQPKPAGCSLHLAVTDEDGKALPKAFVLVHGEHGMNQQFTPDKAGQVKTSLHAGMYDLFVSAMGFVPQAQILDVRACKPVDLNLMLTLDSEHADNDGN
jgi:Carboxypeptidase regulatory-like domain